MTEQATRLCQNCYKVQRKETIQIDHPVLNLGTGKVSRLKQTMSLYPSLEDLKVSKVLEAQATIAAKMAPPAIEAETPSAGSGLYPDLQELGDYMGLDLNSEDLRQNMAIVPAAESGQADSNQSTMNNMVAPLTGNSLGLHRAEIKAGVREVILCKDQDGKVGLRLRAVDKGIFVQLVQANSPASLVGLRFGDQILQLNGQTCAGWSTDKAHKALKQAPQDRISVIVRDRPFQRTITMHKDSTGHVGFIYKRGKITSIVKDSSAARNGLLTDHYVCEINGQNIIGLKDSQVGDILAAAGSAVTITVMPSIIYEHMVKRMSSGLVSQMDHSTPEV
ncbi:syntenin-1-like isoform X1 [Rhincodon typus]|uniref:syntenin-1-like isoform X1 n=2 Tax=Rhincodon typus TaxID=259920 RepID=UPI00202F7194|nr:syntenin-1-like isoform X1 [Rhincodon typus]